MTKEDYMKLSKERLAELLAERDRLAPFTVNHPVIDLPCYAPGGHCMNPFHDCVNCPNFGSGYTWTVNTITTGGK